MSGGGGQIKGYWYSLGIHMGICRGPLNSIVETRVGDKPVLPIFIEITDSTIFPLYNPGLFGGTEGEGGVAGPMNVMMGKDDQTCPFELQVMNFPTPQPGFRRIASVFFNGFVSAISPYPKPWTFRVRRTTKGWDGEPWYPEKATIILTRPFAISEITSDVFIHAMNPAHIFYEVMTNREWGRGLPRAALDDANLRAVADVLYDEGFGLCLFWARSDSIETFVQSILDHIGGVLRPNPTTGELQLKLLRKDYVVADLPLFDNESGLLDITEASVAAMPTITNHVKVTFKDPITGKDGSVGTHNLAGVQGSNGEINTLVKDYPGLCTPDLASRVALRDLRASSNSLRRFSITLDRRGQDVQPGDVIRVRDYTRGIPEIVVRIGKFEEGNNLDGRITLGAVQDIFRMTPTSFTGNQPPTWEGPNTSPCIGYNRSFEMPYFMLAHTMSAADLDYLGDETGFLGQVVELGARPLNAAYKLAVRSGLPTEDDLPSSDINYCPTVPSDWHGGDNPCFCAPPIVLRGTIALQETDPVFPDLETWLSSDGIVISPLSGLSMVGTSWPAWGPTYTDSSGTPTWSESSVSIFVQPNTYPGLADALTLKIFDESDSNALIFNEVMYKGGGEWTPGSDYSLYLQRPVADIALSAQPWPEYPLNDLPQPTSPFAGLDGHVLRYELGDMKVCCGGLSLDAEARFSVSHSFNANVDGTIQLASETTLARYPSIEKIAVPNNGELAYITMFMVDAGGTPLAQADQPAWTKTGIAGTLLDWGGIVGAGGDSLPGMVPGCSALIGTSGVGTLNNGTTTYPVEVVVPHWTTDNSASGPADPCYLDPSDTDNPTLTSFTAPGVGSKNWDGSATVPTDGATVWSAPGGGTVLVYMAIEHPASIVSAVEQTTLYEIGFSVDSSTAPSTWNSGGTYPSTATHGSCNQFKQTEAGASPNSGANFGVAPAYLWVRLLGDSNWATDGNTNYDVGVGYSYTATN